MLFINSYYVSQNMCFPSVFPVSIIGYKYDTYTLAHTAMSCHTRQSVHTNVVTLCNGDRRQAILLTECSSLQPAHVSVTDIHK
jgi:hypothetical protein